MKQIKIGTCVPGAKAEEWLKGFIGKGFETFSLNFHMSLEGTDLDKLALSTEKLLAGTDEPQPAVAAAMAETSKSEINFFFIIFVLFSYVF
jgi:hypothetical protein